MSDLVHPDLAAAVEPFYTFRVAIGTLNKTGDFTAADGLDDLAALYKADVGLGAGPQGFSADQPASDSIALLGAKPAIKANQRLILTWPDGVTQKRFKISAAAPDQLGITTLLTVTPDK